MKLGKSKLLVAYIAAKGNMQMSFILHPLRAIPALLALLLVLQAPQARAEDPLPSSGARGRPPAIVERRRGQDGDHELRRQGDGGRNAGLRAGAGAHRGVRQ